MTVQLKRKTLWEQAPTGFAVCDIGATASPQSKRLIWHFNAIDCLETVADWLQRHTQA